MSGKKIIRGETIEKITFCTTEGAENPSIDAAIPEQHPDNEYWQGIELGRRQGFEVGKTEGEEKGFIEGQATAHAELEQALATLHRVIEGFAVRQAEVFEHAKPEMVQFCLAVCEAVLLKEIENPALLGKLVDKVLDKARSSLKAYAYEVCLSPQDYVKLEPFLKKTEGASYRQDASLPSGHIRVDSSSGLLHYDIRRALKEIESSL